MKKPHIFIVVLFLIIVCSWIIITTANSLSSSFSVHKDISEQECVEIAQKLALPFLSSSTFEEFIPEYLDKTSYSSISSLREYVYSEKNPIVGYFISSVPSHSVSSEENIYFSSLSISITSNSSSIASRMQHTEHHVSNHNEYIISQHGLQVQYIEVGGVSDGLYSLNNPCLIYSFSTDQYQCDIAFAVNGILTAEIQSSATEVVFDFLIKLQNQEVSP